MLAPGRPLLVCFSRDYRLLETRRQVLATRYDVLAAASIEELTELNPDRSVDVVVLCHSLRDEDCVQSSEIIRQRWPAATILTISSPAQGCSAIKPNATVASSDGPAALLGSIAHLLQNHPPSGRQPSVPR